LSRTDRWRTGCSSTRMPMANRTSPASPDAGGIEFVKC
jgi:hypothetical protein